MREQTCSSGCRNKMPAGIGRLNCREDAISTVVSAVLLLGVIVSVITVVHVQYVPQWKNDAEQSHMNDVFYDMAAMKNQISILSAYSMISPTNDLSISVPVKTGGGEIPLFGSEKSGGRLSINEDSCSLTLTGRTPEVEYNSDPLLLDLGAVTYTSDNNYFVDQKFIYENGALIVSQGRYCLMRMEPFMDIGKTDNDTNISITMNVIDLNGPYRSVSSSSVEELHFRSNGTDSLYWDGVLFTDVTVTVGTSYPSSWVTYFETLADDARLEQNAYSVSSNESAVVFFINGESGEDIKVNVTKSCFDVRMNVIR